MTPTKTVHYNATVIVTSDTCCADPSKDQSGHWVKQKLESLEFEQVTKLITEDDKHSITSLVKEALKDLKNALIITVGGTGLCPRDVTPEATSILYEKNCSGIAAALHMTSLRYSSHAALSRLTAGIVGSCLIVNFPGSLKACKECFACLEGFLFHALEQVSFDAAAISKTHAKMNRPMAVVKSQPDHHITDEHNSIEDPMLKSNLIDLSTTLVDLTGEMTLNEPTVIASESKPVVTLSTKVCTSPDSTQTKTPETPTSPSHRINSPYRLIDYDQALEIMGELSQKFCQKETCEVNLDSIFAAHEQLGNVLANDLNSLVLVPPFAVSKMDGYVMNMTPKMKDMLSSISRIQAQLVDDLAQFESMQDRSSSLHRFICYQINTGGKLPERDFVIIPYEKTGPVINNEKNNKKIVPIFDLLKVKPGQFIRPAGSDINLGDCLSAGTIIGPVELSLIQSMGHKKFNCVKKPSIGVLSTGDELIESHHFELNRDTNKVVDINGPLLTSFFKLRQYKVVSCGISKDKPADLLSSITRSLGFCDVLIVTGGASMGTKDFVKKVIEQLGGVIHFGRVNIKPGKPAGFASINVDGKLKFIFTLPGNPVSAYVTSIVLVQPFLLHVMLNKFSPRSSPSLSAIGEMITVRLSRILDADETHPYKFDGRLEFIRAKFENSDEKEIIKPQSVTVSIKQQSSRMLSFIDCDCLLIIEPTLKNSTFIIGQTYQALRLTF